MPALFGYLRTLSGPALLSALFAVSFSLGLVVFAISGSVAISAICMALTSLASALVTREIVSRPNNAEIKAIARDETRHLALQMNEVTDRISDMEADLRRAISDHSTPDRLRIDAMNRDLERISQILTDLIYVVDAQDGRIAQAKPAPAKPDRADTPTGTGTHVAPISPRLTGIAAIAKKAATRPKNPLASLQQDNILREDLLNGKFNVQLTDIAEIETGCVTLRQIEFMLQGRLANFQTGADLIRSEISPGIIQLFDRMRFGFAYEFASQFGTQTGSTPILCPLMSATFADPEAADEIVHVIGQYDKMTGRLVIALDYDRFMRPKPAESERLDRLQTTGVTLAAFVDDTLAIEPELLFDQNVRYVIAHSDILLGRRQSPMKSAIHPADLAPYLSRFDITLIAQNVDTMADANALRAMNIMLAAGAAIRPHGAKSSEMDAGSPGLRVRNLQGDKSPTPVKHAVPSIAPLRERLRRIRM